MRFFATPPGLPESYDFTWQGHRIAALAFSGVLAYTVLGDGARERALQWAKSHGYAAPAEASSGWPRDLEAAFIRYAAGEKSAFSGLRITLVGGTQFQRSVWSALGTIAHGDVVTYGELARTINRPKAVRALGQALGKNPLTVVLPCHRVIGSQNALTGFGCGLGAKMELLGLEGWKSDPARGRLLGRLSLY